MEETFENPHHPVSAVGLLKQIIDVDAKNRAVLMMELRAGLAGYTQLKGGRAENGKNLDIIPLGDSETSVKIISPNGIALDIEIPSVRNSTLGIDAKPEKYRIVRFGNLLEKRYFAPSLVMNMDELINLSRTFFEVEKQIYKGFQNREGIGLFRDMTLRTAKGEIISDLKNLNLSEGRLNIIIEAIRETILPKDDTGPREWDEES